MNSAVLYKIAGTMAVVVGLGLGIPAVYGAYYFATQHGVIWTFLGYPTYGDEPFADVGIPTSVPLLVGFVVVLNL